jgi:thiol:disulfide interchange protein DsbD
VLTLTLAMTATGLVTGVPRASAQEHVTARLISETEALVPGTTARLGVTFEIDEGWHLYWNGQNDTGAPPFFDRRFPQGLTREPLRWPAPERYRSPGRILDHIHEDRLTVMMPVEVSPDLRPGERLTIAGEVDWLVCKGVCLPGHAEVELTLPVVSPDATPGRSREAPLFDEAERRVPRPLPETRPPLVTEWEDEALTIRAAARGVRSLAFYPALKAARPANLIEDGEVAGEELTVRFDRDARSGRVGPVRGVVEMRFAGGKPPAFYTIELPGPEGAGAEDGEGG